MAGTPEFSVGPRMSEVDIACHILKQRGQPMSYRDLISEVLKFKPGKHDNLAKAMASIHTQINLDSRFVHLGNGLWGLKEWAPRSASAQKVPLLASLRKDHLDDAWPEENESEQGEDRGYWDQEP